MNNPKTLAALIAAFTSLIVAILSIVSAFISSKKSAKLAKEVETLKHDLNMEGETFKHDLGKDFEALKHDLNKDIEAFKHYLNMDIETFKYNLNLEREAIAEMNNRHKKQLSALNDSIKSIQQVKDVIQKIINSYENSYPSHDAIQDISTASEELISSYKERFTDLVNDNHCNEQKLFHKAKGKVVDISSYLTSSLKQSLYTSDLPTEEKDKLRAWRSELSEMQTLLQNCLYDNFIRMDLNPKRVLIVDDERGTLESVVEIIRHFGYIADPSASGRDALRKLTYKKYDLIISDLAMPDLSGLELLKKVREKSDTPFILLSGYNLDLDTDTKKSFSLYNATGFMQKPIKAKELQYIVQRTLSSDAQDAAGIS